MWFLNKLYTGKPWARLELPSSMTSWQSCIMFGCAGVLIMGILCVDMSLLLLKKSPARPCFNYTSDECVKASVQAHSMERVPLLEVMMYTCMHQSDGMWGCLLNENYGLYPHANSHTLNALGAFFPTISWHMCIHTFTHDQHIENLASNGVTMHIWNTFICTQYIASCLLVKHFHYMRCNGPKRLRVCLKEKGSLK